MSCHLFITVSLGLLAFCAADNCLRWTPWINGDQDPGSGGDFETVGYSNAFEDGRTGRVTKKLENMGIICSNPLKIECRDASTKQAWFQTGDNTTFPSRINCESRRGLTCRNDRQADHKCHDYEVRLLCWTECPQLAWTAWTNRDRPSGGCDCEHPGWADHPVRNAPACPDGQSPVEIECQTTDEVPAANGPDAVLKCDVDNGFSCFSDKQPTRQCSADYRVRYLCFKPPPTTTYKSSEDRRKAGKVDQPIIPQHQLFPLV